MSHNYHMHKVMHIIAQSNRAASILLILLTYGVTPVFPVKLTHAVFFLPVDLHVLLGNGYVIARVDHS